jgi:ribosomal protein L14E/L6E/L27E
VVPPQAVVVKAFDDGSKVRSFGHCLVAGIDRAPLKVTRQDPESLEPPRIAQ